MQPLRCGCCLSGMPRLPLYPQARLQSLAVVAHHRRWECLLQNLPASIAYQSWEAHPKWCWSCRPTYEALLTLLEAAGMEAAHFKLPLRNAPAGLLHSMYSMHAARHMQPQQQQVLLQQQAAGRTQLLVALNSQFSDRPSDSSWPRATMSLYKWHSVGS